jgi:hypothetical protein
MLFASYAQIFAIHVEKNAISMIWIIAGYAQKFVFIAPKNVQAWLQRKSFDQKKKVSMLGRLFVAKGRFELPTFGL